MNWYFAAAGALCFATGLIHTIFGERLVFKRMRADGLIPTNGGQVLREPHVRILWATWHLVTVLGTMAAAMLAWLALPAQAAMAGSPVTWAIVAGTLASSALVGIGTNGRHPGWVALLAVSILTGVGTL
jgi:hypothetical protein